MTRAGGGFLVLALATAAIADPPPKAKAPPDRKITINGRRVRLPGEWLTCHEASDCAWVHAGCEDFMTGVNAQHASEARAKVNKPCEGTNRGMLTLLKQEPPQCVAGVCAELPGNVMSDMFGALPAPADAGSPRRP